MTSKAGWGQTQVNNSQAKPIWLYCRVDIEFEYFNKDLNRGSALQCALKNKQVLMMLTIWNLFYGEFYSYVKKTNKIYS